VIGHLARCLVILPIATAAAVTALHAQKVDLPKCEMPKSETEITSFSVAMPLPVDKTQARVVRAFVEVGINPSEAGKVSNSVEWDSGYNYNGYYRRVIRAMIYEEDDGTSKVLLSPIEYSGSSTNALNQYDGGYGYKVWCAAKTVSDSLAAASGRIRLRNNLAAPTVNAGDSLSR
jgi:hypothetical protein